MLRRILDLVPSRSPRKATPRTRQSLLRAAIEPLEPRQMLSITLSNGLPTSNPAQFSVLLDGGGTTRDTKLGGTDTVYDYFAYLDTGTAVYNLRDVSTNPVSTGFGSARSVATINLGGGASIQVTVNSLLPGGSRSLINTYTFSAIGYDLRNARFHQYLDADILAVSDDLLSVGGSIGSRNLVLTTIDPATSKRQAQTGGYSNFGSFMSGFGADQYPELRNTITAGGYDPSVDGDIDTISLTPGTFPIIGPGYGPDDITTTLTYGFTAASQAKITTVLGVRDLAFYRPVIILPDFGGSMPTVPTTTEFLQNPGHLPENLVPDPLRAIYDPMLETFTDRLGYTLGGDLFFGAYDWRLPIAPHDMEYDGKVDMSTIDFSDSDQFAYAVEYLDYWLKEAKQQWITSRGSAAGFEVDIVAHGMGGLVARALLQSDHYTAQYSDVIRNLVTVGTPHQGAVNPYLALAPTIGLDLLMDYNLGPALGTPTGAGDLAALKLVWEMAKASGIADTSLGAFAPSLYDMLPTFSFTTGNTAFAPSMSGFQNHLLLDLNADTGVMYDNVKGTVTLAGNSGRATAAKVHYYTATAIKVEFSNDGDGVVLASSAALAGNNARATVPAPFSAGHSAIPSNLEVQSAIVRDYLALVSYNGFMPASHAWMYREPDFIYGFAQNADFMYTDDAGRRIGYTDALGYMNEIAGAFYSGDATLEYFFAPTDELTGDPTFQLTGAGETYVAGIGRTLGARGNLPVVSGTLAAGQTTNLPISAPAPYFGTVPRAALTGKILVVRGAKTLTLQVSYTDNIALDLRGLSHPDIVITGPRNYRPKVTLLPIKKVDGARKVTATYVVPAPGGTWDGADDGVYKIATGRWQLTNWSGLRVPLTNLGTFTVNLNRPATTGTSGKGTVAKAGSLSLKSSAALASSPVTAASLFSSASIAPKALSLFRSDDSRDVVIA